MQRAVHGRRPIGRRGSGCSLIREHVSVERTCESPALGLSGARRIASLTLAAAAIIPPLDRPVIANDRRSRQAWDDLVLAAAEGLKVSAGSDKQTIDAALALLGTGEQSLAYRLLRLAAGMCV